MTAPGKILVVGLGSIGKRHVAVATEAGFQVGVVSRRQVDHHPSWRDLTRAVEEFDPGGVILAQETSLHGTLLEQLDPLRFGGKILVEKPLLQATPDPSPRVQRLESITVGYNLRLHPLLRELRERLRGEAPLTARVHCGSFLPAWRPGTDYRKTSSASRARGGGVLTDLSHELDYLLWLFGPWKRAVALGGRLGNLEIDVPDLFEGLLEMTRCPVVSLHLDYLQRLPRREILVTTSSRTLRLDFLSGVLEESEQEPLCCSQDAIARTYGSQLLAWWHSDHDAELCNGAQGLEVVALMEALEGSAEEGRWRIAS